MFGIVNEPVGMPEEALQTLFVSRHQIQYGC
jgi:hypothetical protein